MCERQVSTVRILTCVIGLPFSSTPSAITFAARLGVIIWLALTITLPSLSQIVLQEKRPVIPVSYTHLDPERAEQVKQIKGW